MPFSTLLQILEYLIQVQWHQMQFFRRKGGLYRGLAVQDAFKDAKQDPKQHNHWKESPIDSNLQSSDDTSPCSQLTSCFQSHLTYNPGVQIDFRGHSVKQNPLRTSFAMQPKSTTISFADIATNTVEFEFVNDGKINTIDRDTQYLIIQVIDNETERNSHDRVIAESLLIFYGSDVQKTNYCKLPIFDRVEGEQSGEILLSATFENGSNEMDEEWIGSKLSIEVLGIIDLQDPTSETVKNVHSIKRDVLLLFLWVLYMIGSIVFYIFGEDFTFIDALYLRIVTAFTVGYGDMFPVTDLGKLLNCLFIVVDTMTIGCISSKAMNYILRFRMMVPFVCPTCYHRICCVLVAKGTD